MLKALGNAALIGVMVTLCLIGAFQCHIANIRNQVTAEAEAKFNRIPTTDLTELQVKLARKTKQDVVGLLGQPDSIGSSYWLYNGLAVKDDASGKFYSTIEVGFDEADQTVDSVSGN